MKYMLLIYGNEAEEANYSEADMGEVLNAYMTYTKALEDAGVMVSSDALQPTTTATTVRVDDGKVETTDGPFAETKEQLGGFYLLDVPDLDTALDWAGKCPGARHGRVEVRPIMTFD